MKFLILLLISFTASASYIKKSDMNKCDGVAVYSKQNKCGQDCIKIDKNYNCNYSKIRPEKWLKEQVESCLDENDCQDKFELLVCTSEKFYPIKNIDSLEVYCTKYRPEKIVDDADKKAIFDAEKATKEQERLDRKAERQEIKGFIQDVNQSDLPQWHKKLLKAVIKDMRD